MAEAPLCPRCRDEQEFRALSRELGRLPVGPVVEARRSSVFTAAYHFRRSAADTLNAAAEVLHREIDGLVMEAARSSVVERVALATEAVQEARMREAQDDEAGLAARVALEGVQG